MEQTWRWFGEQDPISLDHVKQAGASGIVTALHRIPVGNAWTQAEIAKRKALIAGCGLAWRVCESIQVHDAIKRGDGDCARYVAAWKDSLANLGRAGIPVVCYNFMPVVDWTRTDLAYPLPSTGFALRFDMVEFVAYDVFVLQRERAADEHEDALIAAARECLDKMSESEVSRLETNIICGLPGGAESHTRATVSALIESFKGLSSAEMQRHLRAFLQQVVPVAEEYGVRLAIHPDDPPFSLFGLPRVVSTASDVRSLLQAINSPTNGITMCTGSYGARSDNDVVAMTDEFAQRIHFAHLRNVTRQTNSSFYEAEHLDGDTDMVAVIGLLSQEEARARHENRRADIPMRPDHGHLLGDDIPKKTNPGYSYIGRLKGLAELRGVIRAVSKSL